MKTQKSLRDRDIINNPFNYTEMLEKSGRSLSPCVEVNGDEVEAYLLEAGVADAPAKRGLRRASS